MEPFDHRCRNNLACHNIAREVDSAYHPALVKLAPARQDRLSTIRSYLCQRESKAPTKRGMS